MEGGGDFRRYVDDICMFEQNMEVVHVYARTVCSVGDLLTVLCLKKNQNAPRPSEHIPQCCVLTTHRLKGDPALK